MPGIYAGNDYDLAGFSVGAAERGSLLPSNDMKDGDAIIGLASSGVHSNGFSLVRKLIEVNGLKYSEPAPFDDSQTLAEALLIPTRIYVKSLLAAIKSDLGIKALAHITGGGFIDNIPRVLPKNLGATISLDAIKPLPVFSWLAKTGSLSQNEMLRTFNCGIGMIVITEQSKADELVGFLNKNGEEAVLLGELNQRDADPVAFKGKLAH